MTLHPKFREYLDALAVQLEQSGASATEPTPELARAALASLNQFALPKVAVARVFDAIVPAESPVPVRVYVPNPDEPSDVIFFVHGGGHMAGDLDVYDFSARRTAATANMVTVSIDYRRAPEAPYPLGLTDTYNALTNLHEVLQDVRTTGTVHAVADSGGAAKIASIAMRAAAGEWVNPISRQVLLYPSLDYTLRGQSVGEFGEGYFLTAERVAWYFDNYFPAGTDRAVASPLSGPYSAEMPDTLVIAAEYDPLISEAKTYVQNMNAAGAEAHFLQAQGMIHAYAFFESLVPEAINRTYEILSGFLRQGDVPESW